MDIGNGNTMVLKSIIKESDVKDAVVRGLSTVGAFTILFSAADLQKWDSLPNDIIFRSKFFCYLFLVSFAIRMIQVIFFPKYK